MSMFHDISCDSKDKEECVAKSKVVSIQKFGIGQWFLLDEVLKRNGILPRIAHTGVRDDIEEQMLLEFAVSGHPTFRATTPLSRGQLRSKEHGKLSIHFAADEHTIETIFRIILSVKCSVSTEQWQLHVKNLKTIKMDRGNLRF